MKKKFRIFGTEKNRHFWPNFDVFGQKGPFWGENAIFSSLPQNFFDNTIFVSSRASFWAIIWPYTSMYMVRLSKNPNFGPKTSCFGPKWLFLMVQKNFKSSSTDWAQQVCHFEVSYAPLAQAIWPGLPNLGEKGPKGGLKNFFFIKHDEKRYKM